MIEFTSPFGQIVKQHLESEYFIWLTTVGADLAPQPRPVWFIWDQDAFLIFSEPQVHKVAHIRRHPAVALHFNSSDSKGEASVIVFRGPAALEANGPPAHRVPAYFRKYKTGIADLELTPEEFGQKYSVGIRVQPVSVRGW